MRRAVAARHIEAAVVHVCRDESRDPGVACGHDRGEAHRAHAHDQNRVTEPGPRLVQDGSGAGRQAARERTEEFERRFAGGLHKRVGHDDGVGGEGRLPEEVAMNDLPIARVCALAGALALEPHARD